MKRIVVYLILLFILLQFSCDRFTILTEAKYLALSESDYESVDGIKYPSGVYSHWKLDESSGNAIDVKSVTDLNEQGTVGSIAGKIDKGRGQYTSTTIFFKSDLIQNSQYDIDVFLVEGWFKTGTTGTDQIIVSKWWNAAGMVGWVVQIRAADNKLELALNGTSVCVSANAVTDDGWHYFLVGQLSNSGADNARLYIDDNTAITNTGRTFTKTQIVI